MIGSIRGLAGVLTICLGFTMAAPVRTAPPQKRARFEPVTVAYPVEGLEALTLPDEYFIDDVLPLADGGLFITGGAWDVKDRLGNSALIRLGSDHSVQWRYISGLSEVRLEWDQPVHLGGERFAVLQGTQAVTGGYEREILIIDGGVVAQRTVLGLTDTFLTNGCSLSPAPDGFYLHTWTPSIFDDAEAAPESIAHYDRDGSLRYTAQLPPGLSVQNVTGIDGGALIAGLRDDNGVAAFGVCMLLDDAGNTVWTMTSPKRSYMMIFMGAYPAGDGYIVIGRNNRGPLVYMLDANGVILSENAPLGENPALDYGAPYPIAVNGGFVLLESLTIDEDMFRVSVLNEQGTLTASALIPETAFDIHTLFAKHLVWNGEIYIYNNAYFTEDKPFLLYPATAHKSWNPTGEGAFPAALTPQKTP